MARNTCGAVLTVFALILGETRAQPPKLHVPSPDWRDQVMYFVMTDRFFDGDATNNDQGADEFKAGERGKFNGGDLRGLTQKLDYIKGLGATSVWITPPVANQWYEPTINYTGYHGYWAAHFKQVDKHLGTLDDYKQLSSALHQRNMYLVQDIVVNHTGNFFDYKGGWDRKDPTKFYTPSPQSRAVTKPTQTPFDMNDPRVAAHRAAGIYHWTPAVANYGNRNEVLNHQMSSLDDLNTENPTVRRALRDSYGYWIKEVGVDAYRIDTAFYVPQDYFIDFLRANDKAAPGIERVARATGRKNFLSFGEGFAIDKPYADKGAKEIEAYMRDGKGRAVLPSMINFPLYGSLGDVFARGQPSAVLADRITRMMKLHPKIHVMPSFIDNHDVDRFITYGSEAGLKQALAAMFMLPGIPTIYYGTEQGFKETRAAMFAAGWASGGRDRFDTTDTAAPLYTFIAELAELRRRYNVLSRGTPQILHSNAARAGALVYAMNDGKRSMVVAFNNAEQEVLMDGFQTALPAHAQLISRYGSAPQIRLNAKGQAAFAMPARAIWVWEVAREPQKMPIPAAQNSPISINISQKNVYSGDFQIRGTSAVREGLQLVVDGDMSAATPITTDANGRFTATVSTLDMSDETVLHRASVWTQSGAVSQPIAFRIQRPWSVLADVADPSGDDRGVNGNVTYPTDAGYATRQMDLRNVRASANGGALKLELTMPTISTQWNPANGFDHVAFTVYIELPNEAGGATVMPQQNGALPQGMKWHRRLRAHGWSNALTTHEGASAENEGTPFAPGAAIAANKKTNMISLTLPAAALGKRASLSGAKIYVTTWDYDNGYRKLEATAQSYSMGGPASTALVMDDSGVIVLK
jgi:glycosidase